MFSGLKSLDAEGLRAVARLARLEPEPREVDEIFPRMLHWMAGVVGAPAGNDDEVQRAVLDWLCTRWEVEHDAQDDLATIEDRLWGTVSERAAHYLMPAWKVASCMAALGPVGALENEVALLERSAMKLVPSRPVWELLRREWAEFSKPGVHASDVLKRITPELQQLRQVPDLISPTLVLSLVVAMADGNFEMEENRYYHAVASQLAVSEKATEDLKERVHERFWSCRSEVAPQKKAELLADRNRISLLAAHKTLEDSKVLFYLERDIESGYLSRLHRSMFDDPDFQRGVAAWNKTPFLWPLGLAAGVCLYIRSRLKSDDQRNLCRIAFLAYHAREAEEAG